MATDTSNLEEDFRAVIKRFHAFVFSERDPVRKLDWIHARVRDTSRPVDPPQGEIKKFESELDNERETFAEMATSLGRTVEEMIEFHRPKPSLKWRPLFCSSEENQPPDVLDCVFLLAVLHDSIGPYRETPMKPDLAAHGDVSHRWAIAMSDLPHPEDRIQDWEPPSWFVHHVVPRIDEWFKRVQEAFALEFEGAGEQRQPGQLAGGGSAGVAGQTVDVVPAVSPEQTVGGESSQAGAMLNSGAKQPSLFTASGSVQLFAPGEEPLVNGKRQPKLTGKRYDIVALLIRRKQTGATISELQNLSTDAVNSLKSLAALDGWKDVIQLAEKSGCGYRIL